jgi:hypothetical protein
MLGRLNAAPQRAEVGLHVTASFDDVSDEVTLVNWKPTP